MPPKGPAVFGAQEGSRSTACVQEQFLQGFASLLTADFSLQQLSGFFLTVSVSWRNKQNMFWTLLVKMEISGWGVEIVGVFATQC